MRSYQRIAAIAAVLLIHGPLAQECFAADHAPVFFAPFNDWKAAAAAGDGAALVKLYSVDPPPAVAMVGRQNSVPLGEEMKFWTGLKSSGLHELNPKVLEIAAAPQNTRLLLRIEAVNEKAGRQSMVASMTQVWAHEAQGWRIVATQRTEFTSASARRLPEPAKPNPALYAAPSEAREEIAAASAQAANAHKRVLLIFGANWCYDCHVLDAAFSSQQFAPLVKANYVVVHINIGDEGKDNNDLAAQFGVVLDRGIPSLAVLDPDGKVVTAQKNGEFESTVKIGPADVAAFLEKWKPR